MANNDNIITLVSANGENIDFEKIAAIQYKGNIYAILQPVKLLEGMGDDEALVFKVTQKNGEESFEIELDDSVIDAVFKEYDKLWNASNNGGKVKKSQGKGNAFNNIQAAAKKTSKIVMAVLWGAITFQCAVVFIAACVSVQDGCDPFDFSQLLGCAIFGVISFLVGRWSLKKFIKTISKK